MQVPLRMSVDAISFSAHADFPQTSEFIDELQPKHVVLVHGEATEMGRLKRALEQRASATGQQRTFYMPRVTQPVHITHKASCIAKVSAIANRNGAINIACQTPRCQLLRHESAYFVLGCSPDSPRIAQELETVLYFPKRRLIDLDLTIGKRHNPVRCTYNGSRSFDFWPL